MYIVDRVVTAPGRGAEFVRRYRAEHLPAAPAAELPEQLADQLLQAVPIGVGAD